MTDIKPNEILERDARIEDLAHENGLLREECRLWHFGIRAYMIGSFLAGGLVGAIAHALIG